MPKNKKKQKPAKSNGGRKVIIYRWKQRKEFTVLEDIVIKLLEKKGALSDEYIARAFCLSSDDVADIIKDINQEYEGNIQGDDTRRSLCGGFSRDLPDGFAIQKEKNDQKPKHIRGSRDAPEENAEFMDRMQKEGHSQKFGKIRDEFRKKLKIEAFSLEITYTPNDEKTAFRCGGIDVPESFCTVLREKLLINKKK